MSQSDFIRQIASFIISLTFLASPFAHAEEGAERSGSAEQEPIKAYCIDFNWWYGARPKFAYPGAWKHADPKEHVAWYKAINANVIQTFAVSHNGYAWYKSKVTPPQPGLKHDFLTEVVKLGHAEGMKVMGYFSIAANARWGKENPDLSYGAPCTYHIPYTDEYLEYLRLAITEAIQMTGIDGFMIDWVWMPKRGFTKGKWIDAEKKLYRQLMGEDFPGEDKITKQQYLAYGKKSIERCWRTIHTAAKTADPDTIIWLTSNNVNHPMVRDSVMYKEVDWFMGESGRLEEILKIRPKLGKHTRLITCMSDFGGSKAETQVPEALKAGVGVYGYAKPEYGTRENGGNPGGIIDLKRVLGSQLTELTGNRKRIAVMARVYGGKSLDSVWKDGEFVEPKQPDPFKIRFWKRSGTGRVDFEEKSAVITIRSQRHKGRASLTRTGPSWPETIEARIPVNQILKRRGKPRPEANVFRCANGTVGAAIFRKDKVEAVAGKMEGGLNKGWGQGFLNKGKPESPIEIGPVHATMTDKEVIFTVPPLMMEGNPATIDIEWGIDGKTF